MIDTGALLGEGDVIGGYTVIRPPGSGGMGTVSWSHTRDSRAGRR
ncbi:MULTISPECIES: hypothetical protein [unclassified Gordonia (in: high G+C Gram-positive bacteria)]